MEKNDMPMELRQRLRFREFTTKRSPDGVSIGMTFTVDGEPERIANRVWFGAAIVEPKVELAMLSVAMELLLKRFEAFIAGKEDPCADGPTATVEAEA